MLLRCAYTQYLQKSFSFPEAETKFGVSQRSRPIWTSGHLSHVRLQRYRLSTWSPMAINPSRPLLICSWLLPFCWDPETPLPCLQTEIGPIPLPSCPAKAWKYQSHLLLRLTAQNIPFLRFCLGSRASLSCTHQR